MLTNHPVLGVLLIGAAMLAPAPATVHAQSTVLRPNCETLVSHRQGLTDAEITAIEQNAHRLGMSPDELLYWQTQARAKGMDPYAWDTIKLASKMSRPPEAPVCVPH